MAGSHHISRRDFIKLATVTVGGVIGAAVGIPGIIYLVDPAMEAGGKDAWIPLGPLENFEIGKPTLVTFVRTQVNGWEKTSNSYGVFVIRKSEEEALVLSNRCTHLSCRVNWNEEKQAYICPCHDATFSPEGEVLGGPPPRPLDRYEGESLKIEEGVLSIHFTEG
ncbi:MAG: ubiquinol-cytochrome c reductase iron-sulfur subunit [Chloroflexota bacterium]